MSRRRQLDDLRRQIDEDRKHGRMNGVAAAILELLEQAVFVDELPPEIASAVRAKRGQRSVTEAKSWRRRYRCKKHGTITGPLCGDCAQEKVSASSLVEEIVSDG